MTDVMDVIDGFFYLETSLQRNAFAKEKINLFIAGISHPHNWTDWIEFAATVRLNWDVVKPRLDPNAMWWIESLWSNLAEFLVKSSDDAEAIALYPEPFDKVMNGGLTPNSILNTMLMERPMTLSGSPFTFSAPDQWDIRGGTFSTTWLEGVLDQIDSQVIPPNTPAEPTNPDEIKVPPKENGSENGSGIGLALAAGAAAFLIARQTK